MGFRLWSGAAILTASMNGAIRCLHQMMISVLLQNWPRRVRSAFRGMEANRGNAVVIIKYSRSGIRAQIRVNSAASAVPGAASWFGGAVLCGVWGTVGEGHGKNCPYAQGKG